MFRKNKGQQSTYKGTHIDSFPTLVPALLLTLDEDCKKNASPSYSKIAANGVKPGAKLSPRFGMSCPFSWNETSMKAEDWLPVPKGQENIFWRLLGDSFRAQYAVPTDEVMVGWDSGMAYCNETSRNTCYDRAFAA
jgi:hypothetical protein